MTSVHVATPSRLHFGLIVPGASQGRRFGGAGLMIDRPGISLTIKPADSWRVTPDGPLHQRIGQILQMLQAARLPSIHVHVESAPPEHVGLGVGTQLALAIAHGVLALLGKTPSDVVELANVVQRRPRSGIGLHGYLRGGFIVDAGKNSGDHFATLACHLAFPESWRIVLIRPRDAQGMSGDEECRAFAQLPADEAAAAERRELLERVMIPALQREDFDVFSDALYAYNHSAGQAFASLQGGPYVDAAVAEVVAFLRSNGVMGVGQSSWGPTVFALARNETEASAISALATGRFGITERDGAVVITQASPSGAVLTIDT